MNRPHKVLILAKHIDGGTGTFALQLLRLPAFSQDKFSVSLIALEKPTFRPPPRVNYYKSSQNYPRVYKAEIGLLIILISEFFWLAKEVNRYKPDTIISIDTHCSLLAGIIKRFVVPRVGLIVTIHNNLSAVSQYKLSKALVFLLKLVGKLCLIQANAITANSIAVAHDFRHYFGFQSPVVPIPYGLSLDDIKKREKKALPGRDKRLFGKRGGLTVLSIGRFAPQKDFFTLIHAFAEVKTIKPEAQLVIIGDGEEKQKIMKEIRTQDLSESVHLLGWVNNVFPYLAHSNLFVLSSHYEGFGYVLLEAMSQKLPIISTDAPYGPAEVLGNGRFGILVPPRSPHQMARQIVRVLSDRRLRRTLGNKSATRLQAYTEEKMLLAYAKLIEKI